MKNVLIGIFCFIVAAFLYTPRVMGEKICKDFTATVEETVRRDAEDIQKGLNNLFKDLENILSGKELQNIRRNFKSGRQPRIYVKFKGIERAFYGLSSANSSFLMDKLKEDVMTLFTEAGFEWVWDEEILEDRLNYNYQGPLRYVGAPLGPDNLGVLFINYNGHRFTSSSRKVRAQVSMDFEFASRLSFNIEWHQDFSTQLVEDQKYCTLYIIYKNILGPGDNSTRVFYSLIIQTIKEKAIPEMIKQAHQDGF